MTRNPLFCWAAAVTLAALVQPAGAAGAPPPELPVEAFFAEPEISQLRFSPNGRYLAALVPVERRKNLVVMDLEKKTKTLVTRLTDEGIVAYQWANDDRLLFTRDEGGEENYGLYGVDRVGGVVDRIAYRGEKATGEINLRFGGLLRRDRKHPNKFFILAFESFRDRPDIALMDVRSGHYSVVERNPGLVGRWVLDWNDVARFGVAVDGADTTILYRGSAKENWREIASFRDGAADAWSPLAFDGDNRTVYVRTNRGRSTAAIVKYDTATHQFGETVCADETYDVISDNAGSLMDSASLRTVVGAFYQAEKPSFVYWHPEFKRRQSIIDRSLPETANQQIEVSENGGRIVVMAASAREPGVYYLFDETNKRIEQIAAVRPGIDPEQMAEMKPIEYTARDGLLLHGYLTLPRGREPKNLPLVIHPHGGPFGIRDVWRFDPEVQLYANRGCAVLQINYRGSGGYGDAFQRRGYKKWGLEMQDDLTDGAKWAIAEGIADPERVVISGASYGGYAALAGLVFTPELYCAGINYVGVSDIVDLISRSRTAPKRYTWWYHSRIGDLNNSDDAARLKRTSPVHFADRIRVPLLMGYGKNDPRVTIDQGYGMESALKRTKADYKLIVEKDEGHGFRKEEKSIAWYNEVDAFLKEKVLRLPKGEVVLGPLKVLEMPASEAKKN